MTLNLREKLTALLAVYALLLTCTLPLIWTDTSETKEVEFYIVCPYGEDTCTPYHPYEVKVIYK